ncbi:Hsp20/alpha crystallin family protein [Pedomonas mirosovicensis]|uniref:Hsp20/alpha crystallin family protein n=1 Tax=Pedomonas mirosovicensis TaxID=2908641 RepID=UPI002166F5F9|nr:Hsp20/alpha crystallin family protein [Pedomonas mirosovicensis]MCH8684803.1 Hsp20/alpha crystallin family protein [Pedomonas mirosovicensis]
MLNLRREIESMFEDMFRGGFSPLARMGGPMAGMTGSPMAAWPSIEVNETENDLRITAEVPGLSEDDVEAFVEDGVLILRGEKKTETQDQERGYSERYYGHFERRIALPNGVDENSAQADFRNGVLSITLQKSQQAQRGRRIPIGARGQQGEPAMQQAAVGRQPQGQQQQQNLQGQQQWQQPQQQPEQGGASRSPGRGKPSVQPQE